MKVQCLWQACIEKSELDIRRRKQRKKPSDGNSIKLYSNFINFKSYLVVINYLVLKIFKIVFILATCKSNFLWKYLCIRITDFHKISAIKLLIQFDMDKSNGRRNLWRIKKNTILFIKIYNLLFIHLKNTVLRNYLYSTTLSGCPLSQTCPDVSFSRRKTELHQQRHQHYENRVHASASIKMRYNYKFTKEKQGYDKARFIISLGKVKDHFLIFFVTNWLDIQGVRKKNWNVYEPSPQYNLLTTDEELFDCSTETDLEGGQHVSHNKKED